MEKSTNLLAFILLVFPAVLLGTLRSKVLTKPRLANVVLLHKAMISSLNPQIQAMYDRLWAEFLTTAPEK